jgi:hypothetical protein
MRTSTNFVITIDPLSAVDMEKLQVIKKTIKAVNQYSKNKKRVVLRGRKPVVKVPVRNFWTGQMGFRSYDWGGNIVGGIKNATKLDVYIYDRRD